MMKKNLAAGKKLMFEEEGSSIKFTEKMNDILLPPLFKANSANEAIEV